MTPALPPPPPATTCREFLGQRKGYCGKEPTHHDKHGRPFCGLHAIERKLTT